MSSDHNDLALGEQLLERLRETSDVLNQLANDDPLALSEAVHQLESLAEITGDASCGGRFLMMASAYLNFSSWVRAPYSAAEEPDVLS